MSESGKKCVICGREAFTTAVHIPVCLEHYQMYADEAEGCLPFAERSFYHELRAANDRRLGISGEDTLLGYPIVWMDKDDDPQIEMIVIA